MSFCFPLWQISKTLFLSYYWNLCSVYFQSPSAFFCCLLPFLREMWETGVKFYCNLEFHLVLLFGFSFFNTILCHVWYIGVCFPLILFNWILVSSVPLCPYGGKELSLNVQNEGILRSCYLVAHLCLTFCNPVDCSPQGSLSMGLPWQGYWSGLPFPTPGDLPDPGIEPSSPMSPALQADYHCTAWEAHVEV